MKSLNLERMLEFEGGGNCTGTYNACIVASAVAGAAVVAATGGWGSYWGVALAWSGMEYCRQQAIGCQ